MSLSGDDAAAATSLEPSEGRVVFIGAGPGAADLITLRGARVIGEADIVIWAASLVSPDILGHARPDARIIDSASLPLEGVEPLYAQARDEGLLVARVHTGDPSIYGATQEQRDICNRLGIAHETIPGISAFSAAAARMDAEITVPEVSQSFVLTRLEGGRTPMPPGETVAGFAAHGATMAIYLSAARSRQMQTELLRGGYPATTPVIIGYRVSWPDEAMYRCPLDELEATMKAHKLWKHTVVLVGPALAEGPLQTRSLLYHPGFRHGYRKADPQAAADIAGGTTRTGPPPAEIAGPASRDDASSQQRSTPRRSHAEEPRD